MAPGPGGGHADAGPAAELGVADGLERRHLLVPGLDEPGLVVGAREGAEEAVDAVAGVAEDLLDPPLAQACEQVVGDGGAHGAPLVVRWRVSAIRSGRSLVERAGRRSSSARWHALAAAAVELRRSGCGRRSRRRARRCRRRPARSRGSRTCSAQAAADLAVAGGEAEVAGQAAAAGVQPLDVDAGAVRAARWSASQPRTACWWQCTWASACTSVRRARRLPSRRCAR